MQKVSISPVKQIIPLPNDSIVSIESNDNFLYAMATQNDIDESSEKYSVSNGNRAELASSMGHVLILKSTGGMADAIIRVSPRPPPPRAVSKNEETPEVSPQRKISVFMWVGLIILLIVMILKRNKK